MHTRQDHLYRLSGPMIENQFVTHSVTDVKEAARLAPFAVHRQRVPHRCLCAQNSEGGVWALRKCCFVLPVHCFPVAISFLWEGSHV